ncbi:MAG: hypothetical protein LBM65_03610 [Oscillospiraceae bacterium]|jgi:hypothetical protein|nr:hypothetical protein [Oscillospiraceae bacterium]
MQLNGKIMCEDYVVATVCNGVLNIVDEARVPLYLKRTGDAEAWLKGRAIDAHRTNSRLLKRALRLSSYDDLSAVLKVNAATVTDRYWFKPDGQTLVYYDVRFKNNEFASLALRGDPNSFNKAYSPTPELTNVGSYEKCWLLQDNGFCMVKFGNELERFSEVFISKLGQALGLPMAHYTAQGDTVTSPDFTNGAAVNFESAAGLVGEDEDYAFNFITFYNISPALAREYLQIIYMDALCFNMDRHTQNYGVLRDVDNGKILSMAPNFDNNIALFSRGVPKDLTRRHDKLIELFLELLQQDERALAFAADLPLPTADMIEKAIQATEIFVTDELKNQTVEFVMAGTKQIKKFLEEKV